MSDWKPNPHAWRKFKQAERNMMRLFRRNRWRKAKYWARWMSYWIERIGI